MFLFYSICLSDFTIFLNHFFNIVTDKTCLLQSQAFEPCCITQTCFPHFLIKLPYLTCNCVYISTFVPIHCLHMAMNVNERNFLCSQEANNDIYLNCTTSQPSSSTDTELQLQIAVGSRYKGADKSLARPGRKQANVSVRVAWISFGTLPCRKKPWWQLVSWCCWNRARPWHASELVSFWSG